MTVPPLLVLAQGRKVRLRKVPAVRPLEITLHLSCVKLLRDHCRPDWQWCHVPSGEIRDKRTAGKLRRMGTKAGWPDLILIPPTGQICCLELKRIGERLSDSQHDFRTWCIRHGVPHAVAFTVDDALAALDAWGCLTIKIPARAGTGGAATGGGAP
jgi:hypothetical protein